MIRKWLLTALACGSLAVGLFGCAEETKPVVGPKKKVTTAKTVDSKTPAKAATATKAGTSAKTE